MQKTNAFSDQATALYLYRSANALNSVGYLPPERINPNLLEDVEQHDAEVIKRKFLLVPGFREHLENLPSNVEELDKLFADSPKLRIWEGHCRRILRGEVNPEAHGVMVASLILDISPVGKSSVGQLSNILLQLSNTLLMIGENERLVYLGQGYPDVFNFSVKLELDEADPTTHGLLEFIPEIQSRLEFIPESERDIVIRKVRKIREHYKGINEFLNDLSKKILVVVSAGNDGIPMPNPSSVDMLPSFNKEYRYLPDLYEHAILVGSISPFGKTSDFSNHGKHLTIMAPGELISTKRIDGELVAVYGTSVAAPQVTAALADTLALLPDLTAAQAKHLLSQTALYHEENTAGILDHYYLVRVAYEIAERLKIGGKSLDELVFGNEVYMDTFKQRRLFDPLEAYLQEHGFYYLGR